MGPFRPGYLMRWSSSYVVGKVRTVRPPPAGLRRGDKVRIVRGAFQELSGLYQGQSAHERVKILLTLLGASRVVELPSDDVEKPQRRARRR
jgi:transcription antitermination factor NusG